MKLSLVNLVPLKEAGMGNSESLARRFKLSQLQKMLDDAFAEQEAYAGQTPPGKEFDGNAFSNMDLGGYSMNDLQQAIDLKGLKKDVPYPVATGEMTQDEYDKMMSTVKPDRASFEKSSKFDRDEEDQENDDNLNMDDTKFEFNMREDKELDKNQQSIAAKWDKESKKLEGGLFDTSRELEKTDTKQFNINVSNKVSFLTKLRDDGKFKSTKITDDKIEGWAINPSVTGYDIASKMKPTTNEGSCGHGPNGVPGNTPGGTKGMPADDRTRGMLKMLIQKEIAKLNESDPFQDLYDKQNPNDPKAIKGKHYPDEETVKKLKKGPYSSGGQNAQKEGSFDKGLEDLMGKDDFEKATSNEVPGLGDTVIDDKTDISTGKKTFMKMMTQFTDEPFLIETGLKLYDAWARGEGGLKPSRILKILQDTSN